MRRTIRIAARGSRLSLAQVKEVVERLRPVFPGVEFQVVKVRTLGDREASKPVHDLGRPGVFTREVNQALLRGDADIAVHSLKDLPTRTEEELVLTYPVPRGPLRDALVFKKGRARARLSRGDRVGTSSPRRQALLKAMFPEVEVTGLRGNLDTRLRRLDGGGDLDAIVVSEAGLLRLGARREYVPLDPLRFVPEAGQGIIAVASLAEDSDITSKLLEASHRPTIDEAASERLILEKLDVGCTTPLGVAVLRRRGVIAFFASTPEGDFWVQEHIGGRPLREAAKSLARKLTRLMR